MQIQPKMKTHETDLKQLRAERHSEENRLFALKARPQDKLSAPPTLFAMHANGRIKVA